MKSVKEIELAREMYEADCVGAKQAGDIEAARMFGLIAGALCWVLDVESATATRMSNEIAAAINEQQAIEETSWAAPQEGRDDIGIKAWIKKPTA